MDIEKPLSGAIPKIDAANRHDLITPLNQILGYCELLIEEAESSKLGLILSDLNKIRNSARQLTSRLEVLFNSVPSNDETTVQTKLDLNFAKQAAALGNRVGKSNNPACGNILVVDDNADNREILFRRLVQQGHKVSVAENGILALEQLCEAPFDLVLLDVMMPIMDGYEVLKHIKSAPNLRHIPVIIISANKDMDSAIRCIESGAEDYLQKPFNPILLKARIGAALEKKRLREQEQDFIEQTMRAEAELERHSALTQAVAGVAHEINTPLGIACTGISIIENRFSLPESQALFNGSKKDQELFQDVRDSMELIKKNVIRAHHLVENFKKIAVNQILENKETVVLENVINDAVDLFKLSAKQANLSFELDFSEIKGSRDWHGYPGYLIQILLNFFQNIERYAYPEGCGGKVQITVKDQEDHHSEGRFLISVKDCGKGIHPDLVGKIFDPFYTTGRAKGGTGLGLSIVRNIVTLVFKGSIEVSSVVDQGTCFVLQFQKTIND